MNAVATGATADGYDQIIRLRFLERFFSRQEADITAEDERIAEVALVEVDRAIHRGNAHAVAVVAHPGNDAAHDSPRMEHARRQFGSRRVGWSKAEDIRVADRLRTQAGA